MMLERLTGGSMHRGLYHAGFPPFCGLRLGSAGFRCSFSQIANLYYARISKCGHGAILRLFLLVGCGNFIHTYARDCMLL